MAQPSSPPSDRGAAAPWSARRAIATGTLMVGALDACLALIFWGLRGGRPIRIFQSIAAGLLGRASYAGGLPTATLGLFLHFFIAGSIVATYFLASRRIDVLTRRPIACGLMY